MPTTGSCECGAVTYRIAADEPVHVYACHCLDCQLRSGSACAEHAMVRAASFECEGELDAYRRKIEGMVSEELFCRECHTRLFNRNDVLPGMVFLRAGTLNERQAIAPVAHLWTSRKQAWVMLPEGVPAFPESPTPAEFGAAIAQAQSRAEAAGAV